MKSIINQSNTIHKMNAGKIIAIDPGPEFSALVEWNGEKITHAVKEENFRIKEYLNEFISIRTGTPIFCEMIASYGMPVGVEVFETCLFIGNLQQITQDFNQPFQKVFRKDVKIHLCNSMKAKDSNIRQALVDRFGSPGVKKAPGTTYGLSGDMWAAFAVAVYSWDIYITNKIDFKSIL